MSTSSNQTFHAEISIVPVGTGSTGISKEVSAAFDAIRKTKDINTTKLTAMGTQIEARAVFELKTIYLLIRCAFIVAREAITVLLWLCCYFVA